MIKGGFSQKVIIKYINDDFVMNSQSLVSFFQLHYFSRHTKTFCTFFIWNTKSRKKIFLLEIIDFFWRNSFSWMDGIYIRINSSFFFFFCLLGWRKGPDQHLEREKWKISLSKKWHQISDLTDFSKRFFNWLIRLL